VTSDRTDDELMLEYLAGDGSAFSVLFQRWAPRLSSMFARAGFGRDDIGDLVQQSFLQLHRARLDYRPGSQLRPWLYTIALNLQRQAFRRRTDRSRHASARWRSRAACSQRW
jgi:RNA polymerase sigma-70 factor (ECF subfamily)